MSEKSVFREAWSPEMTSQSFPVCLVSLFCTTPEVKFHAFVTSKHRYPNFFFAILSSTLGRFNRTNKKKSVMYTLGCPYFRPFKIQKNGVFLFEISFFVLEILTFFYYANRSVIMSYCLQLKRGKYWINHISGNTEAVFFKLGTTNVHQKKAKWHL